MSLYTREDIIRIVKEQDVRFIRLQFTDIFGTMKTFRSARASWTKPWMASACLMDRRSKGSPGSRNQTCILSQIWIRS